MDPQETTRTYTSREKRRKKQYSKSFSLRFYFWNANAFLLELKLWEKYFYLYT